MSVKMEIAALMEGGEIIARAARRNAPYRTGQLYEYINVTDVKPKDHNAGRAAFGVARASGLSARDAGAVSRAANRAAGYAFAEVFVGPSDAAVAAWPQEVGTINHPPQSFMRPAFDATVRQATETIAFEMMRLIEQAAARRARNAAKAAPTEA
jgi:HK97 gp10 family phage protein